MTQEGFKRKLTAILSADVVGYSRLMREDEATTVRQLTAYRVLITEIIQQYNGRVIDSPGDNILAEFASVVDATNGAIKIQKEIKKSNTDTPEDRRMEFRIGINLGDVIEEENRIYGDGVNIAARVEGLAAAGGISISGTVYEHIKGKLSLGYNYLGEQRVKNISEPVRVYRLLTDPNEAGKMIGGEKLTSKKIRYAAIGTLAVISLVVGAIVIWNNSIRNRIEPASKEKLAYPLPDKPSIAVLPFDNLSGDPNQEYIADGISENIIATLSKVPELFVIARNSTFVFKGKAAKVQKIAEELGVRYVLEGSVQKFSDRLRVTAQLIDAMTGYHVWSEKYDRHINEFFQIFDEITQKIVVSLQVKLTQGEQVRIYFTTKSYQAWDYTIKGHSLFSQWNKADNKKARELFKKAVKLDPEFASAWSGLAWTHYQDAWLGFSENPAESVKRAMQIALKASAMDEFEPALLALRGSIYRVQRQFDKAISEGLKSIELGPSYADSYLLLSLTMLYSGRFEEAIIYAIKGMRLSPYYPGWYLSPLGQIYRHLGRYEEAIKVFNERLERGKREKDQNGIFTANGYLAGTYAMMGDYEKARMYWAEALDIRPSHSLEKVKKIHRLYKDPKHFDVLITAMQKAGIK